MKVRVASRGKSRNFSGMALVVFDCGIGQMLIASAFKSGYFSTFD